MSQWPPTHGAFKKTVCRSIGCHCRPSSERRGTGPVSHAEFGARADVVGIDYISAEQFGAPVPKTHQILFGKGIPVIEGLLLVDVKPGDYDLVVLPIKAAEHEGAPARAILRRHAP